MHFYFILLSCVVIVVQAQYPGYTGSPVPGYSAEPAPTGQDGTVVDTPEVAQAKAAHFAEFARAAARAADEKNEETGAYTPEVYTGPSRQSYAYSGAPSSVSGTSSSSPYSRSTFNSPSVQYQPQTANPSFHQQGHYGSEPKNFQIPSGAKAPFVPAPLAEDGTVVDTPEVAALKAARLQELAAAEQRAYKYGNDDYSNEAGQYQPQPVQYHAPVAISRNVFPGAAAPTNTYSQASQFSGSARSYQPQSDYQTHRQPHSYSNVPQSFQQQY